MKRTKQVKLLKWEEGRQGSGYLKFRLFESKLFKFDLYLLKYPTGSYIHWHTDPSVEGYNHWRCNLVIKEAVGGEFITENYGAYGSYDIDRMIHIQTRFLNIFRPDITNHMVTKVESGTRYVLSLGWLTKV